MSHISRQSQDHLALAFQRAARSTLTFDAADDCAIEPSVVGAEHGLCGEHLLVITIASFVFRLTVLFDILADAATQSYYVRGDAQRPLVDAFADAANLCCGALNRELSRSFPHLGMSIPYLLRGQCTAQVRALNPQYLACFAITINREVRVRGTLCLSCSAPIEVGACADDDCESETGVLELL
jgi:hypothetical protein